MAASNKCLGPARNHFPQVNAILDRTVHSALKYVEMFIMAWYQPEFVAMQAISSGQIGGWQVAFLVGDSC